MTDERFDPITTLLQAFTRELLSRLERKGGEMAAAELNVVRQTLSDFSVGKERLGSEAQDTATKLINAFVEELIRRMTTSGQEMTAAELNVIRQTLSDFSATLGSIPRGDLEEAAEIVAEEFPFDADDQPLHLH